MDTRRKAILVALGVVDAVGVPALATARHLDYTWADDPRSHQPVLVCEGCRFWSCDCGSEPE